MSERVWTCPKCDKYTFFNHINEPCHRGVERNTFECDQCGHRETMYYTDNRLRKLIKKQANETNTDIKKVREQDILKRMAELKEEFEGGDK